MGHFWMWFLELRAGIVQALNQAFPIDPDVDETQVHPEREAGLYEALYLNNDRLYTRPDLPDDYWPGDPT